MKEQLEIYKLINRCLQHPEILHDPVKVLHNERDRMLDELEIKKRGIQR